MLKFGKSVMGNLFLKNQLLVDDSALSEKKYVHISTFRTILQRPKFIFSHIFNDIRHIFLNVFFLPKLLTITYILYNNFEKYQKTEL